MGAFASSRPSTPLRHWVTRCLKGGRPSLKQRAPSSNPRPSQNSRFSAQVAPALSFLGHTHLGVGTLTYPMTIAPQCAVSVSQNVVSRVCWFWKPPAGTHVKCSPKDQSHHSRVPFSSPLGVVAVARTRTSDCKDRDPDISIRFVLASDLSLAVP